MKIYHSVYSSKIRFFVDIVKHGKKYYGFQFKKWIIYFNS